MMHWGLLGILFLVSAALCAAGFKKFVYFLSIGYGLAVAGEGLTLAILALTNGHWTVALLVQCLLFLVYGFRLSGFLLIREMKSASYRKTLKEETDKPMPVFVKVVIWLVVAALYVAEVSPVLYRSQLSGAPRIGSVSTWIGAAVMLLGVVLEAVADRQKSTAKKENPNMVATRGLYRFCRCPNYFGEIVFWTGVLVSAVTVLAGGQWAVALFGYVCIVYIMFNGAQRLERRQNRRYGDKPEYQAYVKKTPILIPLLPIYHLNRQQATGNRQQETGDS